MSNDTNDTGTEIRTEILEHMARAFFGTAWADWEDQYGEGTGGMEVMEVMPDEIDPAASQAAGSLVESLEALHGKRIEDIFEEAVKLSGDDGDRPKTPEMFGHYAAKGALGHGVSLYDAIGRKAAEFVNTSACHMEFTYYDLDETKYPIPADADA